MRLELIWAVRVEFNGLFGFETSAGKLDATSRHECGVVLESVSEESSVAVVYEDGSAFLEAATVLELIALDQGGGFPPPQKHGWRDSGSLRVEMV